MSAPIALSSATWKLSPPAATGLGTADSGIVSGSNIAAGSTTPASATSPPPWKDDSAASFGNYPAIAGTQDWRAAAGEWLNSRFALNGAIDAEKHVLPLNGTQQVALAQRIVHKGLSVREAERLVQHLLKPPKKAPEQAVDRDLLRLQEEISDDLGAIVAIRSNKKGAGKVTFEFGSLDQLDGLLSRLRG